MKSKRKHVGRVFYACGRSKRRKNYKNRSGKQNILLRTLKELLLDMQVKYQRLKIGEEMNLLRLNRVQELLKYVKSLKRQNRKLDQEHFRDYRNDRKLDKLFLKLGGIEKYLKGYYHQLSESIQEHKDAPSTMTKKTLENVLFENAEKPSKTFETVVHFMDKASAAKGQVKGQSQNIPSSIVLAASHVERKKKFLKKQSRKGSKTKNSSLKGLKTKNSFENLVLGFLQNFEKPKLRKDSSAKKGGNKTAIDKYIKRQGPIPSMLVYKWPASISAVVLAKHKRSNARRTALWQLRQISPAVNGSINQSREKLIWKAVEQKQINLNDYGSESAFQIIKKQRRTKHKNQYMEPKWEYSNKMKHVKRPDERILRKNVYNGIGEVSPQTSLKSGGKKKLKNTKYSNETELSSGNTNYRSKDLEMLQLNASHADKFSWDIKSTDSEFWDRRELKSETMDTTASKIINSLLEENPVGERVEEKPGKRVVVRLSANQFTPHYERSPLSQIDDVFHDLIDKNNEWQEYIRDLEGSQDIIKSYLKKRYLQNVRTVLQNQVRQITQQKSYVLHEPFEESKGKEDDDDAASKIKPLSWSAFALNKNSKNRSSKSSNSFKTESQINRNLYASNTLEMHRRFFTKQMIKLRKELLSKNIKHLYNLIMNRELPIRQEDRDLLAEYSLDPQHYNILIMATEPTLPQTQSEAKKALLEENFKYVMGLIDRDNRRTKMMASSSFVSVQMSQSDTASTYANDGVPSCGQFNFDKAYVKEQRAKWARYFALQEKTPLELHLANKKNQKIQARKALGKQRQQDVKKPHQILRSLSALYTAPRLTNRMRKALTEMAEDKREQILLQTKRNVKRTFSSVTDLGDRDTEFPRSCCSQCNLWQNESGLLTKANLEAPTPCPPAVPKCYPHRKRYKKRMS